MKVWAVWIKSLRISAEGAKLNSFSHSSCSAGFLSYGNSASCTAVGSAILPPSTISTIDAPRFIHCDDDEEIVAEHKTTKRTIPNTIAS